MKYNFANKIDADVMSKCSMTSISSGHMQNRRFGLYTTTLTTSVLGFPGVGGMMGIYALLCSSLYALPGNITSKLGFGFFLQGRAGPIWVGVYLLNGNWYVGYCYPLSTSGTITDLGFTAVAATSAGGGAYSDKIYIELNIDYGTNTSVSNLFEFKYYLKVYINGTLRFQIDDATIGSISNYMGGTVQHQVGFIMQSTAAVNNFIGTYDFDAESYPLGEGLI